MPDISMCQGRGCSRRNNCYRHRAQPGQHRQVWMPFDVNADDCTDFLSICSDDRLRPPSPDESNARDAGQGGSDG